MSSSSFDDDPAKKSMEQGLREKLKDIVEFKDMKIHYRKYCAVLTGLTIKSNYGPFIAGFELPEGHEFILNLSNWSMSIWYRADGKNTKMWESTSWRVIL
jgi:hypothetical protein